MTRRRTKYALMTGALIACVTGISGLSIALGEGFSTRLDATATRDHSLDERTERLIENLSGAHELVISADLARLSPAASGALGDLLDALDRTQNLTVTVVDSREALADLIDRLATRDADDVLAHTQAITESLGQINAAITDARTLTANLRVYDTPDGGLRALLDAAGASLERAATGLEPLDERFADLRERPYPGATLPEADVALSELDEPGARLVNALNALDRTLSDMRQTAAGADDASAAEWARTQQAIAERVRTELRRADDALRGVGPLEPVRLSRAIERTELILLIGPERTTALGVRTLVPDANATGADAVRLVREGESTLATALASAAVEHPPILVLVHGAQQPLLDRNGQPVAQLEGAFGALANRLQQRGMGLAEWAVSANMPMPDRAALDPSGERPIVWMTTGIPAPQSRDRYARVLKLGTGISRLIQNGESVLLTLPPSDAEAIGSNDTIASVALAFGLAVRTGTPLITAADGRDFRLQLVRDVAEGSALAPSVEGLPVLLPMPSPIELMDPLPTGVSAEPLLIVPGDSETWGESKWFELIYAQNAPPPTPTRDADRDRLQGPYVVAATASRVRTPGEPSPTIEGVQRLVVITGADDWFSGSALLAEQTVDGARSLQFPGNGALFDASISYLAGLDELLAREARTADVARIRALSGRELFTLRLLLIGGLPLGILLVGGVWRVARG